MWLVESYATDHFARPVKSKNPGFGVLQGPSLAYTKVVQCVQLQKTGWQHKLQGPGVQLYLLEVSIQQ